jgi:hypothetical protein
MKENEGHTKYLTILKKGEKSVDRFWNGKKHTKKKETGRKEAVVRIYHCFIVLSTSIFKLVV